LNSGDELFLITDGIIESRNAEGQGLEIEGLQSLIKQNENDDSVEFIKNKFTEFTNGNYEDDVSMIYIKLL
jgi:serine phosphatase RsbU (regulator of sigma subunit)